MNNSDALSHDDQSSQFQDAELANMFDRYSRALDAGDQQAADAVLAMYPEIGEEFHAPLRGLYLLGCEARQRKDNFELKNGEPRQLGDFRIGPELGRGGMGIVYSATQISLQREVALKILPFTAVLDPRQVARFQNEAKSAASLHHPNIVPVYGVGCERGVHFYSMQLIDGQTIAQLIEQFRRTTKEEGSTRSDNIETVSPLSTIASIQSKAFVRSVIQLGVKIANAIQFAHEHGIVHRDIKPSNLLLDRSGEPWVADFGLARSKTDSNLTSQGDQLGTLRYMSPEQAAGRNHQVDFRTDIYSLGVTLYELLSLAPAFAATDRMELMNSIQHDLPEPIKASNRAIPADLETIVLKAIEKSPADRYASAGDMATDLENCLNGRRIVAKRKSAFERSFDAVSKNKKHSAAIACGLVMVTIAAISAASVFLGQRERERIAANDARLYLQQAHSVVDRFSELLSANPSATESVQASLLAESIGYYQDFLHFTSDRTEMTLERGQAHFHLARLYERSSDNEASKSQYRSGIEAISNLSSENSMLELANGHIQFALFYKRLGESKLAEMQFESAIKLVESRSDAAGSIACAEAYANIAMLNVDRGNSPLADKQFQMALNHLPNPATDNSAIAAGCRINGCYISFLSKSKILKATELSYKVIKTLTNVNQELRQTDGKETQIQENEFQIANLENNLAIMLAQDENVAKAKVIATKSLKFWKRAFENTPERNDVISGLATAANTLGEICWREKEYLVADHSFQMAEKLFRKLRILESQNSEHLSRIAGVLHNRSLIAFGFGDLEFAKARIEEALKNQSKAIDLAPEIRRYQVLLNSHRQAQLSFLKVSESVASQSNMAGNEASLNFVTPAKDTVQ